MEQAAEFAARLPAWTGPDGLPLSWQHFVYGMGFLGRSTIRAIMDTAAGVRGGMATQDGYKQWRNSLGPMA